MFAKAWKILIYKLKFDQLITGCKRRLREGNVSSRVCVFQHGGPHFTTTRDAIDQSQITWDPPTSPSLVPARQYVQTCSLCSPDICWQTDGWHSIEMPSCFLLKLKKTITSHFRMLEFVIQNISQQTYQISKTYKSLSPCMQFAKTRKVFQ